MSIIFIIFGVLLTMAGFSFLFTPLINFLAYGQFIIILVLVYGIFGIVQAISKKKFGIEFVFSIISTIFGIAALFIPDMTMASYGIMVYLTAAWFILMGVVQIITSIKVTKLLGSGVWIFQLILGILAIIIGIASFARPIILAEAMGIFVAIYFIETGFTMIFSGIAARGIE